MAYSLRYHRGVSVSAWSRELTQKSQRVDYEVCSLLSGIKRNRGIPYQVVELRIRRPSDASTYPDEEHKREIYSGEFSPRSRALKNEASAPSI